VRICHCCGGRGRVKGKRPGYGATVRGASAAWVAAADSPKGAAAASAARPVGAVPKCAAVGAGDGGVAIYSHISIFRMIYQTMENPFAKQRRPGTSG